MVDKRNKKMVSFALDQSLLEDMERWIAAQTVPPSKTSLIEIAIRKFLENENRKQGSRHGFKGYDC